MKTLNKKLKNKTGFTLVELIVVISILAILGTIAFLSYGGFSSKARDGSRISDTSSLSKGLELYSVTAGKYPAPEQITGTGIIGTTSVAYLGTMQNQISTLTKISKTPRDPLSDNYYIYGTTSDYKQYQIATTLENILSFQGDIGEKAYADSQAYSARVLGNYKGLIKFSSGTTNPTTWISNIPSLIYNSGTNLLSQSTRYSINKSTNLPYTIKDVVQGNLTPDEIIKQLTNNQTATLTGINITDITTQTGITENSEKLLALGYDLSLIEKIVLGTSSAAVAQEEEIPVPTNSCNTTQPTCSPAGCTLTAGTPTAVNQSWVKGASNCGFTCNANYSGTNCETYTAPVASWRDIPGTSCDKDDIIIGGKTWAGCNSVLGTTGISTNANIYNGTCSNYVGGTTATNCNATYMTYTGTELAFNSTHGVNNIWGKLYLRANAVQSNNACPTGWHLPSDTEFKQLEIALNGGINCRNTGDSWLCSGLGWSGYKSKLATNNIVKALNLPLSGSCRSGTFYNRGEYAFLWSSTEYDINNSYTWSLYRFYTSVERSHWAKTTFGASVRCVKD